MTRAINIVALALVLAGRPAVAAEETNAHTKAAAASRVDFDSFRLITERNIFNPNRSGRRDYTRREPDRRSRVESFALVGTMSYEKGRFAFFDGTSSDYRKVIGASDRIAGYTIGTVTPEHVTLQSTNHGEIKLPLGMQMRRVEDGDWELSERSYASSGSVSSATSTSDGASSSSSGGSDDVLKRLMQRREQEGTPAPEPVPSPRDQPPAAESNSRPAQAETSSGGGADDVLKRLLQRREQETQR